MKFAITKLYNPLAGKALRTKVYWGVLQKGRLVFEIGGSLSPTLMLLVQGEHQLFMSLRKVRGLPWRLHSQFLRWCP